MVKIKEVQSNNMLIQIRKQHSKKNLWSEITEIIEFTFYHVWVDMVIV